MMQTSPGGPFPQTPNAAPFGSKRDASTPSASVTLRTPFRSPAWDAGRRDPAKLAAREAEIRARMQARYASDGPLDRTEDGKDGSNMQSVPMTGTSVEPVGCNGQHARPTDGQADSPLPSPLGTTFLIHATPSNLPLRTRTHSPDFSSATPLKIMIPNSDDLSRASETHTSVDALDNFVEELQADSYDQHGVRFEKRLSSYFSDPYRSPTHSATSSPVGSISAAAGQSWRDYSATVSSPSGSMRKGLVGDKRSSTLRMSRLCSLSECGEYKASAKQSGLGDRKASCYREEYPEQKEQRARDHSERQSLKSPLISITLPSSTRLASLASSSSISNLLALSTSSGFADARSTIDPSPSTPPPTIPLPVLPPSVHGNLRPSNDKKTRRRIKLRSPRLRAEGSTELAYGHIPQEAESGGLGADVSTGQGPQMDADRDPMSVSTVGFDSWRRSDCSLAVPSIQTTPASSTAPQFPAEVFSPDLLAPFGASEVVDPSAPTINIPIHLPGDDTFGDLAGRMRSLGELVGQGSDENDRQRSGLVLEFPLPPARSLPASPEPHPVHLPSCHSDAPLSPALAWHSSSAAQSPATSVQPAEVQLEALAISAPTGMNDPEDRSSPVITSPQMEWDMGRKGSMTSETSLTSASDEGFYGTIDDGDRSRFSGSSFASAPSLAPVTPKTHLQHLRPDGRTSVELASEAADEMESLIDGDIHQLLTCAERGLHIAATQSARFQVHGSNPGLAPPGPDSAYWGEPEIVLADVSRSRGIGPYKDRLTAADGRPIPLNLLSSASAQSRLPRFSLRKRSVGASGSHVGDPPQAEPSKWSLSQGPNALGTAVSPPLKPGRPGSGTLGQPSGHSYHTVSGDSTIFKMAAILPFGAIVSRSRAAAAMRVGRTIAKGINRVGMAAAAAQYARPAWARLTEKSAPNYQGHLPLNWFENAFLTSGSAVIGVADTKRGDLVALLSETSSQSFMPRLHGNMSCEPEGRQILRDRPLISSKTVDLPKLKALKRGTLGREWVEWLEEGGVTPDTRHEVVHIDSPTLAYTMTRYRQTHDLYHTLFSLPPTLPYELTLKVLELSNMSLPVAGLSSAFGPFRMTAGRRQLWREDWVPWALRQGTHAPPLVGIYWEKRWEQGLADLRQELGVARMDNGGVMSRWKSYREIREREKALRRSGEWIDEPED